MGNLIIPYNITPYITHCFANGCMETIWPSPTMLANEVVEHTQVFHQNMHIPTQLYE